MVALWETAPGYTKEAATIHWLVCQLSVYQQNAARSENRNHQRRTAMVLIQKWRKKRRKRKKTEEKMEVAAAAKTTTEIRKVLDHLRRASWNRSSTTMPTSC